MTFPTFPMSPVYEASVQGLMALHSLTLLGREDGDEADALRDSLEDPWFRLSSQEKRRITGLSADLDSIGAEPQLLPSITLASQRGLVKAVESRKSGEWDVALDLLREWSDFIDPVLLAQLRGTVWEEAGHPEVAALFLNEASRLESITPSHAS